jgi:hypothetical protein
MPTGKDSRQITAIITFDEYVRLKQTVEAINRRGNKATISKYVAGVLRKHWETQDLDILFKANGS